MTERVRREVVEVLRCAADRVRHLWPVRYAHEGLHRRERIYDLVRAAKRDLGSVQRAIGRYRGQLLEAALRVEEGQWP